MGLFAGFEMGKHDGDLFGCRFSDERQSDQAGHGLAIADGALTKAEILGDDDAIQGIGQGDHTLVRDGRIAFAHVDDVMPGLSQRRDQAGRTALVQEEAQD